MDISDYLNDILVVYKHDGCHACDMVNSVIEHLGYKAKTKIRSKITRSDFLKKKLVVVVGGDGTTLKAAQMIRNDSIVFSVNSFPTRTEGFLTRAKPANFMSRFNALVKGKAKITSLSRLKVKLNNKTLPFLAVNEVSITSSKPYLTLIYEFNRLVQKSTGLLIATPMGSTAWARSAGGKPLSLSSKKMQYVVREPYQGNIYRVKKKSGFVDDLKIKALTDGIIVFDSIDKEFKFKKNDIIKVEKSSTLLNFVDF